MTTPVELHNISYSIKRQKILDNVSFTANDGEFIGLIGPNGGGKSTLLKLILGLIKPDDGNLKILGTSPEKARTHVGYVPQYPSFDRTFPITVEDTVLLGRLNDKAYLGPYLKSDRQAAMKAMKETETYTLRKRYLAELSGGQLQRVLIARALACDPKLLLLDEPTTNIDQRVEEDIFQLLKTISERMTILLVSHDIGFISQYISRVACLNQTLLCHETTSLDDQAIEELYGQPMNLIHHHH